MFQRQARDPFPKRNMLLLAALVLSFLGYLIYRLSAAPKVQGATPTQENPKPKDGSMRPDEIYHLSREYPFFQPDLKTFEQAMASVDLSNTAARGPVKGFSAPWKVEGPGNIGARVNTIKVHPTNPNIIYVGYARGGVWKTNDGGANWFPIFDNQDFLAIGDIELDPQNPNVVYVGTGDPNISSHPGLGDGLWKSTDGGNTWQSLGLSAQRIISKIIVHPTNANTLYVSTMGLPFERNNQRGLYKTTNGGQSWQQVLFVSNECGVIDMEMDHSNPDIIYAAVWDRIRNSKESLVSGNNARIWKTTNGGTNWTKLEGGLPNYRQSRIGVALSADNQLLVALYVDSTLNINNFYYSNDGGANWSTKANSGLDPGFMGGFGWYFGKVYVNPFNKDDIFACGVELWRSLDGGDNWFQATPDWFTYEVHADMHDMAFIDADTYLLATDGGLYRTTDAGLSWVKIENIPTSQFYRVAHNPHNPEWFYGGMQDNGTSGGNLEIINEWPRIFGGDGFQPVFHPTNPDIFYAETQNGGIWGTVNGFFEPATNGIDPSDRRNWDMPYQISAHDPDVMFAGTNKIYMSFGHPPVWLPVSEDLTDGVIYGNNFHDITTLHESPLDANLVYVGTSDANVWRGNPFTGEWENISAGLPERYVSSVRASLSLPDRVYVTMTGYRANDNSPHLFRSDNRGNSWQSIAGNLPGFAINDLLILPGHQDSIIFVATDAGVYGTADGGNNWARVGADMPKVQTLSLAHNPQLRRLVAGTFARSIYTFPLDSLKLGNVSTNAPGSDVAPALRVTPNPAFGEAAILLERLKPRLSTQVLVCDLNGRIVWQTQVSGAQQHRLPLPVAELAPGVYVAFARSEGRNWGQQKFVIAR
jgi:photosystem II stability/assembly factor-like uncharacterized protein